ncbi:MAG: class I SAM-dependent methyltransferase [SAR202 cluster bacterium]|nr:class I SAM-dependent methyltransferase [SAR202 cluster bacterium]
MPKSPKSKSVRKKKSRENRLYRDLAWLWPIMDPPEDYALEASFWRQALRERLGPGRHPILELGVGGGHNLSHLTKEFKATAVDISKPMLVNARKLNPGVEFFQGDMRSVRLGRKFKAVLIHDAIAYMRSERDLKRVFATAKAHLDSGGVFICSPDWYRETYKGTHVDHRILPGPDGLELTYLEHDIDPDPFDTTIETRFFYIIKQDGKVRVEQDLHITGLFPLETWLELMDKAGFDAEALPYPVYDDGGEGYLLRGVLR